MKYSQGCQDPFDHVSLIINTFSQQLVIRASFMRFFHSVTCIFANQIKTLIDHMVYVDTKPT